MASQTFDMVVVGAGPGGYVAAIRGAQLGLKVCVVEREHLGGICLNWGCIPTKALLRSAEVFHLMQRAGEFGLTAEGLGFDLDKVVARSRGIAKQLNQGVGHLLKKNGVTVVMGEARLDGPRRVVVGDRVLEAGAVVLATGARARDLPGLEADGKRVWSYRHALQPPHMPKRLLVIGSGAIGIEFASFYNALGAEVTVVEVMDRILPAEDAEIAAFAKKQFVKQGMTVLEGATVTALDRQADRVVASVDKSGDKSRIEVDAVISAVGIVGNVEGLGLEDLGVRVEKTHVVTDRHCRTGIDGLYAIGDLAGAPWLAHKASHEGVMVAELIAGGDPHPVAPDSIAGCTYCQPQVASVGLTEAKAKAAGHEIRIGRFPFIGNGKAIALGEAEGMVKTIFDATTGALLGAHMVGAEVTELIQGYVIGRQLETTEEDLMLTVFPHPTLSEMMHESVLDAWGRAIHF
ncbi:dihydrolipoyl dehydrogenase [Ponticoccus alexandrii]|uniref:Dihydrolipoyl dehydrogenase n=1 Tax=Ponticoccus alexandrii TaxID=1943633 RepID=A0ABX7FA69_9RHOB|nr:dihydrolipoyl dehydrogenase [Ponticoccus alexandrii]ETA49891.1 dihydrolipoamide dehydrogenase [Rhodobacteraceae bacterium PD-2]QRF67031.1 dihydrolipoyl dehydrogenase [Ponticoccus alexandrii]